MRTLGLVLSQIRSQNRIFWRVPIGAFFTLIFPVMLLVLFIALFGNESFDTPYGTVTTSQFYTPGLAVFAAASATYTNIGINLTSRRELGILKRVRGTPLPPWVYLAGVVGSAVWIALVSVAVMVALGVLAYGVNIEAAKLPALVLAFVVGSAAFATAGVAVSALAKTMGAAQSITNATLIPLGFVSNVFISLGAAGDPPRWLEVVGDFFPLKHFATAFGEAMSPFSSAPAFEWGHLAVMGAWLAAAALVAARRFRWAPAGTQDDGGIGRRARAGRSGSVQSGPESSGPEPAGAGPSESAAPGPPRSNLG